MIDPENPLEYHYSIADLKKSTKMIFIFSLVIIPIWFGILYLYEIIFKGGYSLDKMNSNILFGEIMLFLGLVVVPIGHYLSYKKYAGLRITLGSHNILVRNNQDIKYYKYEEVGYIKCELQATRSGPDVFSVNLNDGTKYKLAIESNSKFLEELANRVYSAKKISKRYSQNFFKATVWKSSKGKILQF